MSQRRKNSQGGRRPRDRRASCHRQSDGRQLIVRGTGVPPSAVDHPRSLFAPSAAASEPNPCCRQCQKCWKARKLPDRRCPCLAGCAATVLAAGGSAGTQTHAKACVASRTALLVHPTTNTHFAPPPGYRVVIPQGSHRPTAAGATMFVVAAACRHGRCWQFGKWVLCLSKTGAAGRAGQNKAQRGTQQAGGGVMTAKSRTLERGGGTLQLNTTLPGSGRRRGATTPY